MSELLSSAFLGCHYSRSLAGLSLDDLAELFSQFLFPNIARGPHLQKPLKDLAFRHCVEPFNYVDKHESEVSEKFRPLIHTAYGTTVNFCFPFHQTAVNVHDRTTYFAERRVPASGNE